MQIVADGSQIAVDLPQFTPGYACFGRDAAGFVRASRDPLYSDVIEKPLPRPFSCALCVSAEAQAESAGGRARFSIGNAHGSDKGWGT